ncbi:hypothetical protein LEMLEM_LOCUS6860 [Lemmus lemmus]
MLFLEKMEHGSGAAQPRTLLTEIGHARPFIKAFSHLKK